MKMCTRLPLLVGLVASSVVLAEPVDEYRHLAGGWTFAPVVDMETATALAFFGVADAATVTGANIELVLYERDLSDNSWTLSAWEVGTSIDAAVAFLRAEYGDDALGGPTDEGFDEVMDVPAVIPASFEIGLFDDDPLAGTVASSNDPVGLTEILVDAGYSAAPMVSEGAASSGSSGGFDPPPSIPGGGGACYVSLQPSNPGFEDTLLQSMTFSAETALFEQSTVQEPADLTGPNNEPCSLCAGCDKTTTYTPWVLTGSTTSGSYKICSYSRTKRVRASGKTLWKCKACNVIHHADIPQTDTKQIHATQDCPASP